MMLEALPAVRAGRSTRVSAARMRRRTAGRLGPGGGPGSGGVPTLSPPEPQVLQEGEGELAHEHVVVQPAPAPALEWPSPSSSLSCWCSLLAHPARLDQRRQASSATSAGWLAR
jgi:hypothetical protein